MKVYISVDIEGVAGITHWDEAEKTHRDYPEFREQMTREAVAAIEGAQAAGAREIWVKDAHDSGRNLITSMLPADIRLIRSWAGHPLCMVQELDDSFDAIVMIGYHSPAGSEANSLAHTLSLKPHLIRLNGRITSEFYIHALAGSMLGVPTVFVSGDGGPHGGSEVHQCRDRTLRRQEGRRPVDAQHDAQGRGRGHPQRCVGSLAGRSRREPDRLA
jgi:D-amino peptidase